MEENDLQSLVESISLTYFERPFKHRATWNKRLCSTGGRYHLKSHNLDFNPQILVDYDVEVLTGIIKHELCHYHLHLLHKGYQHRDADFKQLLQAVGGLPYAPTFGTKRYPYRLECQRCQHIYYRQRKINTQRYRCGRCGGPLKLLVNKKD